MRKTNFIIGSVLILLSIGSCSSFCKGHRKSDVKLIDSLSINESISNIVQSYVDNHPQYNSFVLICLPEKTIDCSSYYLIGPAYEGLFKKEEFPVFYFKMKRKLIFIKTKTEDVFSNKENINSFYKENQIKRGIDSLRNKSNWLLKDGDILYYHKAVYFSVNEKYKKVSIISSKPDTLFLPQLIKTVTFSE